MKTPEPKTNMTTDPKRVKLIIQRDALLKDGRVATPGQVVEVDEEEAKELLAFCVDGYFDFSGERGGEQNKQRLIKAIPYRETSVA